MTYQIMIDNKRPVRCGITTKVKLFATREDAIAFSDSMLANFRCDWKSEGRRTPKHTIIAA